MTTCNWGLLAFDIRDDVMSWKRFPSFYLILIISFDIYDDAIAWIGFPCLCIGLINKKKPASYAEMVSMGHHEWGTHNWAENI